MREPYALKGARTVPGRGEGGNTLSLFDAGVPAEAYGEPVGEGAGGAGVPAEVCESADEGAGGAGGGTSARSVWVSLYGGAGRAGTPERSAAQAMERRPDGESHITPAAPAPVPGGHR